jgi:hypothetical protein
VHFAGAWMYSFLCFWSNKYCQEAIETWGKLSCMQLAYCTASDVLYSNYQF